MEKQILIGVFEQRKIPTENLGFELKKKTFNTNANLRI